MKNTNKNLLTAAFILLSGLLAFTPVFAQNGNVGIGTTIPNASAILDLTSTNQGLLIPRMDQSQEDVLFNSSTPLSLIIFNINKNRFRYYSSGAHTIISQTDDGYLRLTNDGLNVIDNGLWGDVSTPDADAGWRLRLRGTGALSSGTNYGLGVNAGTLWFASPSSFRWYRENVEAMSLQHNGLVVEQTVFSDRLWSQNGVFASVGGLGTPVNAGTDNKGYSFIGASSIYAGMFSLEEGSVSLFGNNTEALKVNTDTSVDVVSDLDIGGNVTINNAVPFQIVQYEFNAAATLKDTGKSVTEFNAIIGGFLALGGDINEGLPSTDENLTRCIMIQMNGNWWINADFRTNNSLDESWIVEVLFIDKKISSHSENP